ncbi:MAG: hypothetical protein ACRCT8_12130 [Lacipirellulaceae bacterium]
MLTKQEILAARDLAPVWVDVPEWGGGVYVRGLRGDEAATIEGLVEAEFLRGVVARGVCDAAGDTLGWTDVEVLLLGAKSAAPLLRLFGQITLLSGVGVAGREGVEGNSQGTPSAAPGSGSPSASGAPSASSRGS